MNCYDVTTAHIPWLVSWKMTKITERTLTFFSPFSYCAEIWRLTLGALSPWWWEWKYPGGACAVPAQLVLEWSHWRSQTYKTKENYGELMPCFFLEKLKISIWEHTFGPTEEMQHNFFPIVWSIKLLLFHWKYRYFVFNYVHCIFLP